MYVDTRNALLFLLLVAAALITWYFGSSNPVASVTAGAGAELPLGYYLRDAVLFGADSEGRIFYEIHAKQVSQIPEEDVLQLDAVRVQYRGSEDVQWQVSAERAAATGDRAFLDLSGAVRLANDTEPGANATIIETDSLRLEPERHLASTQDIVRVTFADHSIDATGMKAYLKEDRLELESKVHGQFHN
jgi:lipopolysaccharide export system protein LptC